MSPRATYWLSRIAAAACLLAAMYCFLWIFSSSDLAATYCNFKFSLFAPTFRCRQPQIAMLLCGLFLVIALVLIVKVRQRHVRNDQETTP